MAGVPNLPTICRLCATEKSRLRSILHDYVDEGLPQIITEVLRLEIAPDDGLPQNACKPCASTLFKMRDNIEAFRASDKVLRRGGIKGEIKEPVKMDIEMVEIEPELPGEQLSEEKEMASDSADIKDEDFGEESSDSDYSEVKQKTPKKRILKKAAKTKEKLPKLSRRMRKRDPNLPRQNDHKCYICKSDSLESAKALLDHLSEKHLDLIPTTCTECLLETIVLKNVRGLNNHRKMHAQPYKCEYCDRRYSDDKALLYHLKTFHLGENAPCPSTCETCGKVCPSKTSLRNHMRDHTLRLKCEQCEKVFHKHSKLKRHISRVHEKAEQYPCGQCSSVLHSLETYNSHLKMHNNIKDYHCELCEAKFHTAANLWLHRKVHENANYKPNKDWTGHFSVEPTGPNNENVYSCKHCTNTYASSGSMYAHLKHHFKDVECDQCGLKFINESSLKTHYVVHTGEKPYKCEVCGKGFGQRYNMIRHSRGHQK